MWVKKKGSLFTTELAEKRNGQVTQKWYKVQLKAGEDYALEHVGYKNIYQWINVSLLYQYLNLNFGAII